MVNVPGQSIFAPNHLSALLFKRRSFHCHELHCVALDSFCSELREIHTVWCDQLQRLLHAREYPEDWLPLAYSIWRRAPLCWPHQLLLHPEDEFPVQLGAVNKHFSPLTNRSTHPYGCILRLWGTRTDAIDHRCLHCDCWLSMHVYCSLKLKQR